MSNGYGAKQSETMLRNARSLAAILTATVVCYVKRRATGYKDINMMMEIPLWSYCWKYAD